MTSCAVRAQHMQGCCSHLQRCHRHWVCPCVSQECGSGCSRSPERLQEPLFLTQSRTLALYHVSDECMKRNVAVLSDQPVVDVIVALGLPGDERSPLGWGMFCGLGTCSSYWVFLGMPFPGAPSHLLLRVHMDQAAGFHHGGAALGLQPLLRQDKLWSAQRLCPQAGADLSPQPGAGGAPSLPEGAASAAVMASHPQALLKFHTWFLCETAAR